MFRVSGITIFGKENVQRRGVKHTRRREGEQNVRQVFLVCFYVDLRWVEVGLSNKG